jgi:hypothetical protein
LDIAAWLTDLGLGRYIEAFEANDIDAAVLSTLHADDLKELGVTSLGHRKKLLAAISVLTPPTPATPPRQSHRSGISTDCSAGGRAAAADGDVRRPGRLDRAVRAARS